MYLDNFNWSELDDIEDDRKVLLSEFKRDMEALNRPDLEEGLIPAVKRSTVQSGPPMKFTPDERERAHQ